MQKFVCKSIWNKCKIFPKTTTSAKFSPVSYQVCAGLEIPWLRVRISAGRALKERQCTLKGHARYVNAGQCTLERIVQPGSIAGAGIKYFKLFGS